MCCPQAPFTHARWICIRPTPLDQAAGAFFSHFEEISLTPAHSVASTPLDGPTLKFLLQFESSGEWPDHLGAISALKAAIYLELAELLQAQAKFVCNPTRTQLDVCVDGYVFIGTIVHDGEAALLEDAGRTHAANVLRQETVFAARHTASMHSVAVQHPAFALATRLAKQWAFSQLFSSLLPSEMIEMLVATLFITPGQRPPGIIVGRFLGPNL